MSRTHIPVLGAGASILMLATACGGGGGAADEANGEVNILGYAAAFEDNYTTAVLDAFEEETGITANFVPAQNSAEMLGQLRSESGNPTIDVVIMDTSVANTAIAEGLLAELDPAEVPNVENVVEMGQNPDGYGPAVTFDNLTIIYNTESVTEPPTSFSDLWEVPDNSVALPAPPDIQGIALTVLTADEIGADYQQDIQPAIDRLAELAPKVQTWDPQPDAYQLVTNDSAQYAIAWNARSQFFSDESGGTLGAVSPEDGIAFQVNTINAIENSPNPEAATQFIDYALSPEAQEAFAAQMFYAPTISNVELPAEVAERVSSPEDPSIVEIDWAWMADERDGWTELWRRHVIGG